MSKLSVILCTHNPRTDYLRRVLDALKTQTLPMERWELLLIDNASKERLAEVWDLWWHPRARHIREDELGLTFARLRGIGEATGDILVFIDDDNVLAESYLEDVLEIARQWPILGVWGGNIQLEFEKRPRPEMEPFCSLLALQTVLRPTWSNLYDFATTPAGAGMCVRKSVARRYAEKAGADERRLSLGRRGGGFDACEDLDMCWTAVDCGMGCGLFPELKLTHLISGHRVELDYLLQIQKGVWKSYALLRHSRAMPVADIYPLLSPGRKAIAWLKLLRSPKVERRFKLARWAGEREALQAISGEQSSDLHP
jgi:glycosyltransferase involved in cell wall biosynthesis